MIFRQTAFRVLALVLLASLVMTACAAPAPVPPAAEPAAPEPAAPEPAAPEPEMKVLVMAVEGSAPTFDPLGAEDSRVDTPSINLYNALVQVTPGTTEVENELAEAIEPAADGLSYTFTRRKGVKFHDGSELTAADVKYTIDRMLALQKGVYRTLGPITGAEAPDDYTVVISLAEPFPGLIQALVRLYVVNADVVKAHEEDGDWAEKWLQNNEAGSGPFTLVSFEPEQQFTMERFADYFKGWESPHVDRVTFRVIKEESTRRLALEQGDVDWTYVGTADTFQALQDAEGIKTYADETLNQLYIAFNLTNEYLQDVRVRQALALTYDYVGHVESVRNGLAAVARGPLPAAIPCFDDSISTSETNLEKAKELMAEAGYPDGGFELSINYQGTMAEEVATMQLMQAGAAELGVSIKPEAVEWPAKVSNFSTPETSPGLGTIWAYPNYPDPDAYLWVQAHSSQAGGGGFNFAYYQSPEMDALLEAGKTELDPVKRCEIYKEAQQLFNADLPYMNITVGFALAASRDYVDGYLWSSSHSYAQNVYLMSVEGK